MDLEEVTWAGHKPGSAQLRTHRLSYSQALHGVGGPAGGGCCSHLHVNARWLLAASGITGELVTGVNPQLHPKSAPIQEACSKIPSPTLSVTLWVTLKSGQLRGSLGNRFQVLWEVQGPAQGHSQKAAGRASNHP